MYICKCEHDESIQPFLRASKESSTTHSLGTWRSSPTVFPSGYRPEVPGSDFGFSIMFSSPRESHSSLDWTSVALILLDISSRYLASIWFLSHSIDNDAPTGFFLVPRSQRYSPGSCPDSCNFLLERQRESQRSGDPSLIAWMNTFSSGGMILSKRSASRKMQVINTYAISKNLEGPCIRPVHALC